VSKTFKANLLSNTSKKAINASRYNKFVPEKTAPDITKVYEIRRDGWRRKR
jgi:hypothetical protein